MGAGHGHALYIHEHSPVHHLPPQVKVAAVALYVVAVAITPREALWAFASYAVVAAAAVVVARVPPGFLLLRLAGILPFVVFALFIPFIAGGDSITVLGLSLSVEGLWAAWGIVAKATLGATASIVLVATTEIPDILRGLSDLRVPSVLVAIAGFMVRYLELIAGELGRMRVAMTSRGHDPRWLWQARPIATAAGALFVRSYERGERIHSAMVSRGFTGEMPRFGGMPAPTRDWVAGLAGPVACLLVSAWVLVAT
jgi:cobalt/nickel transport system permease protein